MDSQDVQIKGCQQILEIIGSMSPANLSEKQVHKLVMMREIARQVVNGQFQGVSKIDVARALRSSIDNIVGTCKETLDILSRMSPGGLDDNQFQLMTRMKEIAAAIADRKFDAGTACDDEFVDRINETDVTAVSERIMGCMMETNHDNVHIMNTGSLLFVDEPSGVAVKHEEYFIGGQLLEQNDDVELLSQPIPRTSICWPQNDEITLDWVEDMMLAFKRSSWEDVPSNFQFVMPVAVLDKLVHLASNILSQEPNSVMVNCSGEESRVVLIGDIQGQLHNLLCLMYNHVGMPSERLFFVFNGNYIGKGPWGLEVFLVLLAWKVLMPSRVYLLRGSHETKSFSSSCGFKEEVLAKYGDQGDYVYNKFLGCFKNLPLASIISNRVYTVHGGLFRGMQVFSLEGIEGMMRLGSLHELSGVNRYLVDTMDEDHLDGGSLILNDVLCSDPSTVTGLRGKGRQGGLWWGPDCTEAFLKQSKLKFIIRSHEGPVQRARRKGLESLCKGFSEDHSGTSGKLFTLFSAPDHSQFTQDAVVHEGAYAVLKPPDFKPEFHSFRAADKPQASSYSDRNDEDEVDFCEDVSRSLSVEASSDMVSMDQSHSMDGGNAEVDFGVVGISNPPSWNILLEDEVGKTQLVQLSEAPEVEGLPLSSNLEEPHKSAYSYLLKLIAALKYEFQRRDSLSRKHICELKREMQSISSVYFSKEDSRNEVVNAPKSESTQVVRRSSTTTSTGAAKTEEIPESEGCQSGSGKRRAPSNQSSGEIITYRRIRSRTPKN